MTKRNADALAAIIKAEKKDEARTTPARHRKTPNRRLLSTVPANLSTLVNQRVVIWLNEHTVLGGSGSMTVEKIADGKLVLSNGDKVTPAAIYKLVRLDA